MTCTHCGGDGKIRCDDAECYICAMDDYCENATTCTHCMEETMKTITMTELRSEPGEIIRAVQRHGESFRVTKGGKPAARLVPDHDESTIVIERDGTVRGDATLLAGVAALHRGAGY